MTDLHDGLRISQVSVAWTIAAGTGAIIIGILGNSLVLTAFGAVGLLDAVGSGSLIVHFRHSLRHEVVSERHERIALLFVTCGMAAIGLATLADSSYRLSAHATSDPGAPGVTLAGVSAVTLAALAFRKRRVAQRIPSHALHADGWLSALGAGFALVALAGTGLDAAYRWWWADPVAATGLAIGSVGLSASLIRGRL